MPRLHRGSIQSLPDEYGPMTDLIFSLFAVSILLLSIVGTNANVTREKTAATFVRQDETISDLKSSLDDKTKLADESRQQIEELLEQIERLEQARDPKEKDNNSAAEIERLRRQLDDALTKNRALTHTRSRELELTHELEEVRDRLREDRAEKEARDRDLKNLQTQLADARKKNEELSKAQTEKAKQIYNRLEFPGSIRSLSGDRGFLVNGKIDKVVLEEIRTALIEQYESMDTISANRVLVEIDIASSYRSGTSGDPEDPDYVLTLATAAALNDALRHTPMPIACVIPVPYGKMRSGAIVLFTAKPSQNDALRTLESRGGESGSSETDKVLRNVAARDTHIRLVAERIYSSPCNSNSLLKGIVEWNSGMLLDP